MPQARFLRHEVTSLRNSIDGAEFVLNQLKSNAQAGRISPEILPAIGTLEQDLSTMRRSLNTMEEILDAEDGGLEEADGHPAHPR